MERTLLAVVLAIRTIFAFLAERASPSFLRYGRNCPAERTLSVKFYDTGRYSQSFHGTGDRRRLTVGALGLLSADFGLDRRFLGLLFRLILMLFECSADWIFAFFAAAAPLRRTWRSCSTSLFYGCCRHTDVRYRAHRAARLADRAAESPACRAAASRTEHWPYRRKCGFSLHLRLRHPQ